MQILFYACDSELAFLLRFNIKLISAATTLRLFEFSIELYSKGRVTCMWAPAAKMLKLFTPVPTIVQSLFMDHPAIVNSLGRYGCMIGP